MRITSGELATPMTDQGNERWSLKNGCKEPCPTEESVSAVPGEIQSQDAEKASNLAQEQVAPQDELDSIESDPYLIKFSSEDRDDPKHWSTRYKWTLIVVLAGMSLTSNLNVLVCAPAIPAILREFNSTSSADATLIVSIWNLGATVGCLIQGPLSEIYGRLPVYNVSNILCLLVLVAQSQSRSIGMVLTFRCLNGLTVAATALNPSIVGDIFAVEQRGKAQSLLSLMPLLGPVIGPIVGGWISQARGWRWAFWFTTIFLGFFSLLFAVVYRETYEAQILRRWVKKKRKETGNNGFYSKYDHPPSIPQMLITTFSRPLRTFMVPVFLIIVISSCIVTGYTYLIAANITTVYETVYGFSEGGAGLVFLGIAAGMALSSIFCGLFLDRYTSRMKAKHGHIKPEWRLPPMILGFISTPLGLFMYGWTAQERVQYVVPIIGTVLIGFGSYVILIPMTTYIADTFGIYRASALSAMSMFRNGLSTVLPLAGPALYQAVGLGWGNSVLAFIALALVSVPLVLLRYGERLRKSSNLDQWE